MLLDVFKFWQKPDVWHRYKALLIDDEVDYILSTQNIAGGFANQPLHSSYLETCYYALVSLGLSQYEHLCNDNIKNYILSHICVDGGFGDQPNYPYSNIFNTYYALVSLSMLDSISKIKVERTKKYILDKFRDDGGFSEHEDEPSGILHSLWSILSLDLLNFCHVLNKNKVKRFLLQCKASSGLFSNYPNCKYGYLEYTAYCIIINDVLSLDIQFDKELIIKEIGKRQLTDGISSYYLNDYCYSDTFWAFYIAKSLRADIEIKFSFKDFQEQNVWMIFITLIQRLLCNEQKVVSNEYQTIEISKVDKNYKLQTYDFGKFKNFDEVRFAGFELFKCLSLNVKSLLKNNKLGILLDIHEDLLHIFWENTLIGNNVLQLLYPTARTNKCKTDNSYLHLEKFLILYDSSMESCIHEYISVKNILNNILNNINITVDIVSFDKFNLSNFCPSSYQLIHITGHSDNNEIQFGENHISLIDFFTFIQNHLFAGLIVCNICNESIEFLKCCQNSTFTVINYFGILNGRLGYEFVNEMYKYLLSKNDIAESVRLAKNKLMNGNNFNYLNYILWGDPNLHL